MYYILHMLPVNENSRRCELKMDNLIEYGASPSLCVGLWFPPKEPTIRKVRQKTVAVAIIFRL